MHPKEKLELFEFLFRKRSVLDITTLVAIIHWDDPGGRE